MSKSFHVPTNFPSVPPRNSFALLARKRKAGVMQDRRKERGGSKNRHQEFLKEYREES